MSSSDFNRIPMVHNLDIIAYTDGHDFYCPDHRRKGDTPIFDGDSGQFDEGLDCAEPGCENNPIIENPHYVTIGSGEDTLTLRLDIVETGRAMQNWQGCERLDVSISFPGHVQRPGSLPAVTLAVPYARARAYDNDDIMGYWKTECEEAGVHEAAEGAEGYISSNSCMIGIDGITREVLRNRYNTAISDIKALKSILGQYYGKFID